MAPARASMIGEGALLSSQAQGTLEESALAAARTKYADQVTALAKKLKARAEGTDGEKHPTAEVQQKVGVSNNLEGCIFVGHANTDMDSVGAAIAAAELYGGVAARAEMEVNGEIEFALQYAGYKSPAGETLPPYFADCPGAFDPRVGICLVDHNNPDQMIAHLAGMFRPKSAGPGGRKVTMDRLRGVIDHHALAEGFASTGPLFMDVKPWGSACTIVADGFIRMGKPMPQPVARCLLCAVLSDTVNLTSPTTTDADRLIGALLCTLAEEDHVNQLAKEQFKAKTKSLVNLPAFDLVRADQKAFTFSEQKFSFSVVEVNEPDKVMAKSFQIAAELRLLKKEKECQFAFLAVVDLEKKQSSLVLCGPAEVQLAKKAFPEGKLMQAMSDSGLFDKLLHKSKGYDVASTAMDIGGRISRKLEFVPPLGEVLNSGWKPDLDTQLATEFVAEVKTTMKGQTLVRDYQQNGVSLSNKKGGMTVNTAPGLMRMGSKESFARAKGVYGQVQSLPPSPKSPTKSPKRLPTPKAPPTPKRPEPEQELKEPESSVPEV